MNYRHSFAAPVIATALMALVGLAATLLTSTDNTKVVVAKPVRHAIAAPPKAEPVRYTFQ